MMSAKKIKTLIVDDEPLARRTIREFALKWLDYIERPAPAIGKSGLQFADPNRVLDEVARRIVAEVLLGLIGGDPNSYLNAGSDWKPELPGTQEGQFTMADLLRFARVA